MNYETKRLITERLIIKKGEKEDFLKVYEYDFRKLFGINNEFKLEKQDLNKINDLFKDGTDKYYEKLKKAKCYDWIIYYNHDPIGNIFVESDNYDALIDFKLHPMYWDKNFMKEALTKVIDHLFEIGFENVICSYQDGNKNAKSLAFKLYFKPFKILKDEFLYNGNYVDVYKLKLNKEDWLSRTGKIEVIDFD